MGGLICNIGRNAILQFQTIPTDAPQLAQFDAQMRQLVTYYDTDLVSDNDTQTVKQLCAILAKSAFTLGDRQFMLNLVEALYDTT
jgi:hypothetical protein